MSSLVEISQSLSINDFSLSECQDYLDQAHSRESTPFYNNVSKSMIEEVLAVVSKPDFTLEGGVDIAAAKCLLANLLSTTVHAGTSGGMFMQLQ